MGRRPRKKSQTATRSFIPMPAPLKSETSTHIPYRHVVPVVHRPAVHTRMSTPVRPTPPSSIPRQAPYVSTLRILVRTPTRSRPEQAIARLTECKRLAGRPISIEVVVDDDDASMATPNVRKRLSDLGCVVTSGKHKSKVEAVNAGVVSDWDILVLFSDDMVPVLNGWAIRVEQDMLKYFPQLDGALHYDDGKVGVRLCTLPIQGRRLYDQFGYVYEPRYASLWCDNEQTEVLRNMDRLVYVPMCLMEHRHPIMDKSVRYDELYQRNEAMNLQDKSVYHDRKMRGFDAPKMRFSILIATMPSRADTLERLLKSIWDQVLRHPRQVEVLVDAGDGTTGAKRQRLLDRARGEFIAFVDDDDTVSGNYVDRILGAIDAVPTADCVEFHVEMHSGGKAHVGHCSTKYTEWSTVNGIYQRTPNHLSPVRRALAIRAGFPDKTFGEDHDYSMKLRPHLNVEAPLSSEPLYFYYPSAEAQPAPKVVAARAAQKSYSQNDEEAVILRLLGNVIGRFLDIGAHDGVTFSNTRRLGLSGWGGTLVEPSPAAFSSLMRAYAGRQDVQLAHAAIIPDGPQKMIAFHDSHGDMVSTLSDGHRAMWNGRSGHDVVDRSATKVEFQPIYVAGISVASLLAAFPGPYRFINLDVEGMNFELFEKLPLRSLGVEVVCVEFQDRDRDITRCARDQGYALKHTTSENLIFSASR